MIVRVITRFLLLAAVFLGVWYALSRVDWIGLIHIEDAKEASENKLGDLFWETFSRTQNEYTDSAKLSLNWAFWRIVRFLLSFSLDVYGIIRRFICEA